MPGSIFTESVVEEAALSWLEELGYSVLHGPHIAPGEPAAERRHFSDVLLTNRLESAIAARNPKIPWDAREEAVRKVLRAGLDSTILAVNNHRFHRLLLDGVPVQYQKDGRTVHDQVWLLDFDHPDRNDWLAVNQFTVTEGKNHRRPDVVIFINGLPLGVIELKNPGDEQATVEGAFTQIQTYKAEIPNLFTFNAVLAVSDGVEARTGTLTAEWDRFMPWRTIAGDKLAPKAIPELEVLLKGMFDRERFLDLVRYFIAFEVDGPKVIKRIAGYHQYHAVNKAVACTLQAAAPTGDRRIGVVWHTQGSGKSLTMAFYAGKIIQRPEMENPTLVVLTDRNDLDDQLFNETFAACHELLRQRPVQAQSREDLRKLLSVASGGVVFTTIQKFMPESKGDRYPLLSDRRNIVVIADEAHRSQYDFIDGLARNLRDALPKASFIGFTGTPIEQADHSTPRVFGDYIDIYDIQRAVEDKATVPIFYEARLAKLTLDEAERPHIDPEFEEVTEGEEFAVREKLKSKWARLEQVVGTQKRIELVAKDLVRHFEQRQEVLDGKGMIVCMSRRICVDLYNEIIRLRPAWHRDQDDEGVLKVVMTGSATDPPDWQPHIRNKERREELARRFKDPKEPFRLVIVRDMWLTGFDAPSLHTMYLDKPMRGHGLLQAIARVNRVFRDKPSGLVVDYLGIAEQLKEALATYTDEQRGETGVSQDEAVAVMLEKYEIVLAMFHGFDYSKWTTGTPAERLSLIPAAMEHVLSLEDGKQRFVRAVTELSKAFAMSVPHEQAIAIRDDVGFFQTIRARLAKVTVEEGRTQADLETAIRRIIAQAVVPDGVVDIFHAAGLKAPDISILSDEFLAEIRDLPQRNLAVEMLRKLLNDEIRTRSRRNLIESRSFSEMLEKAIKLYQNRIVESAQVIEELIRLAKELRASARRGEELGLSEDELAFYDALAANESAVEVLGDLTLRKLAHELVQRVRANTSIDWAVRESVRAKLRRLVKNTLRRYGYPPDKREQATDTVIRQAELLSQEWAA